MRKISTIEELHALESKGKLVGLFDVPIDLYHGGPGLSSTGLKALLTSPAHFKAYMAEERDSVALRQGRLAHLGILEPDRYAKEVAVAPECDKRTKEGKAIFEAFTRESAGKEIASNKDHTLVSALRKSVEANTLANRVLSGGTAEVSAYWVDEETGVLCRARADYLNAGIIIDLKTTTDATFRAFQRQSEIYKYHLSAAFYLDGFKKALGSDVKSFGWVAVEKSSPYAIAFYAADDTLIEAGRVEYRQALTTFLNCAAKETWPAYPQEFVTMGLSRFYGV